MRATVTEELVTIVERPVSADARERAALHVLDWLGCALVGARSDAGSVLVEWATRERDGPCRVLGAGHGSVWTAALVNGALGNVLEMDDIHRAAILHPGPVVIPAALAIAERERANANAFLDAIVRGYESMIRIGAAVGPAHYQYWHNTATCGPFGAASAAATLLGLDRRQHVHALGNAGTQAAGLWQVRHEPVMSKQLHNGRAAHAGVLAADLARGGFSGPAAILEGPQGFFRAMCGAADPHAVLADPAAPWQIFATGFKPWPACRHAHSTIDAALALRESIGIDSIAAISVRTYRDALTFCDRPRPRTTVEAKFSLQHAVAVALVAGKPRLEHFDPHALDEPRFAAVRERVSVAEDAALTAAYPQHFGAEVALRLADGTTRTLRMPDALGDSENPLSLDALREKARMLMTAAGLDLARAERIIDATLALPRGGALASLTDLLP